VGSAEAQDLRDGDPALNGRGVKRALANINGPIAQRLRGFEVTDQVKLDEALISLDNTPNKTHLGGNATIAVSLAAAHAAAALKNEPLFLSLGNTGSATLPMPEVQIFGGGAHARRRVDIQDFMVVPVCAQTFAEALTITAEVYHAAEKLMASMGKLRGVAEEGGLWPEFDTNEGALETLVRAIETAHYIPGDQVAISLDVAATQFFANGRYRFGLDRQEYDSDTLGEILMAWLDRFPILAIEDPMAETDFAGFRRFAAATANRIYVIGDDLLATNAKRIEAAAASQLCNAALIKPNQAGTLTETRAALDTARNAGWTTIVSARSGETEDVTIAHLAVAWHSSFLKVGSFSRSERMAKWNEVLRIEEKLASSALLAKPEKAVGGSKSHGMPSHP
jgi:enolase